MSEQAVNRETFSALIASTDREFARELVETFRSETPALLAEMRNALQAADGATLRRCAHSLKSNAATFGAHALRAAAKELEDLGREGRLNEVGDRIDLLEAAFGRAAIELQELCR